MPGKRPHHATRKALLRALESTDQPIDAFECARLSGESVYKIKQALSNALAANLVHVARRSPCLGGERYFYRPGPAPLFVEEPMHETLRAMYAAARAHGRGFTADGKLKAFDDP